METIVRFTSYVNWLSKIELIKDLFFFSVKIYVFRVKHFDMLKIEILKKQTKNTKFWSVKN